MGILDDAIREHLDLKRKRGADPVEVEQDEREALGPVRRGPEPNEDEELEPRDEQEHGPDEEELEPHGESESVPSPAPEFALREGAGD